MTRLEDGEMSFQRHTHQADVANKVEEFVACRLVGVVGFGGVEDTVVDTELGGILVEGAFEATELTRTEFLVDKHQGIVEAAPFDEVEVQQGLYLVEEDKSAAGGDTGGILRHIVDMGALATDDTIGEINHTFDRKMVGGSDVVNRACLLTFEMQGLGKAIGTSLNILLTDAHTGELQQPGTCGAVKDGHLSPIQFDQHIVDITTIECRHEVLDGGDIVAAAAYSGATSRLADVGGQSGLGDDIEPVGTAESNAEIGRGRTQSHGNRATCVKAHARQTEFLADGSLFH